MTKKEAIKNIKEHCYFANLIPQAKEALDVAIKALEQQPCANIPFLLHKEFSCPLDECVKAYDVAIKYLRSKAKMKG